MTTATPHITEKAKETIEEKEQKVNEESKKEKETKVKEKAKKEKVFEVGEAEKEDVEEEEEEDEEDDQSEVLYVHGYITVFFFFNKKIDMLKC